MRWDFKDFDENPELSSDIEWMIQSGQVSRELILETLVAQYYTAVYLLAISLTDDRFASKSATHETFLRLMLNLHQYRSTWGVKNWVNRTAYQICAKKLFGEGIWRSLDRVLSAPGQFTDRLVIQPSNQFDRDLWERLDGLDRTTRTLMILKYVNGWEDSEIAVVTGLAAETIEERLRSTVEDILNPDELYQGDAQVLIANSLGFHWNTSMVPDIDQEQFVSQVSQRSGNKRNWRREISTAKEMVLLGLALIFVILIIWGGNMYLNTVGG